MKKLLLVLALLAGPVLGQAVDSDHIKKKTDGGIQGDSAKALTVAPKYSATAPASPITGQLWCDTNFTPCVIKLWNGSAWVAPMSNASLPIQADVSAFPGSPVDGQIFFSKAPPALYFYDATATRWYTFPAPWYASGPNLLDVYGTTSVIAAPGAATATSSATVGSIGSGAYSWKITCRNATGGETTAGTVSNSVTPGSAKSADLSAIPTCGTGGVTRNVYRSITAQAVSGPWYYLTTLNDNTTTTLHDGAADGTLLAIAPDINYSAALPTLWAGFNTGGTIYGGCGGTGASRASVACMTNGTASNAGATSDPVYPRAYIDISAYAAGNWTINYRIKQISRNGDTYTTTAATGSGISNPSVGALRAGTSDSAVKSAKVFGTAGNDFSLPWTVANHNPVSSLHRVTAGNAVIATTTNFQNIWPQVDALPVYVRIVKRGVYHVWYFSSDGINYGRSSPCTAAVKDTAGCSDPLGALASTLTTFEISPGNNNVTLGAGSGIWFEIDSWSLTVP